MYDAQSSFDRSRLNKSELRCRVINKDDQRPLDMQALDEMRFMQTRGKQESQPSHHGRTRKGDGPLDIPLPKSIFTPTKAKSRERDF